MNHFHLTLEEFQQGGEIPFDEQLVLLNNPGIFDGYTPFRFPLKRKRTPALPYELFRYAKSLVANGFDKLRSNRIFVGYFDRSFDHLDLLNEVFDAVSKVPERQFEILIGKGDYVVEQELVERIPANVTSLHANNMNARDSRFRYFPMGRDFRSIDVFRNRRPCGDKKILCYCNFSVNTHPVRQQVQSLVEDKSFIVKQHLGQFLNYSISREEFFDTLQSSKFCICPRGNAFDTFRMWDTLYSGTIPIVVKEAVFHEQLEDLPILFLDSYDDVEHLDEQVLESIYSKMLKTKYNFEKLTASWWLNSTNN